MSVAQREAALARANERRLAQADIRRELGGLPMEESWARAAGYLRSPPECCERMHVWRLLTSCRLLGPMKASAFLRDAQVVDRRPLCALSPRQVDALCKALERNER